MNSTILFCGVMMIGCLSLSRCLQAPWLQKSWGRTASPLRLGAIRGGSATMPSMSFSLGPTRFTETIVEEAPEGVDPVPIVILTESSFKDWVDSQDPRLVGMMEHLGWTGKFKANKFMHLPSLNEGEAPVTRVMTVSEKDLSSRYSLAKLPNTLPAGYYTLTTPSGELPAPENAALGWALGSYKFDRYKSGKTKPAAESDTDDEKKKPCLVWPKSLSAQQKASVVNEAAAFFLVRDLINTPCEDMGPGDLQRTAEGLVEEFGGSVETIIGDDLLKKNYPQIHAVGRAAQEPDRTPRLIKMEWGSGDKLVTLVGKGVCFDTGGLDIKPAQFMLNMKKDMGGSAQVLGLARWIMSEKLPIKLRVFVPAVENAISGNAYRPGDVLTARNGKTTEISNTDAEGRLVLADALVDACSENPDLLIDCATLTGAARVALGTDCPAMFCNDDELGSSLQAESWKCEDKMWQLPLFAEYNKQIESKIADLKNTGLPQGGAISAALYLQNFVSSKKTDGSDESIPWVHIDFMGTNTAGKPGKPEGGEAQGMRALYNIIKVKYAA
mmetsp:Transcript_19871/g.26200  ORF Transcript_19871/g.26200 Transcript_19871/m.26200 type:complete len:554 (+) Transcript_19871:30-1691(+)